MWCASSVVATCGLAAEHRSHPHHDLRCAQMRLAGPPFPRHFSVCWQRPERWSATRTVLSSPRAGTTALAGGSTARGALMDDTDFRSEPETGTIVHLVKQLDLTEGKRFAFHELNVAQRHQLGARARSWRSCCRAGFAMSA